MECPGRRGSHPHLDIVCPHGPALVGQWELVRRHRALEPTVLLSYGSRRRAAKCPYAPSGDCGEAPPERGEPTCTANAPEVPALRGPPPARRSRIACPAVGVAFLLLQRHATPADGGPCPGFPRPSLVKQRAKLIAVAPDQKKQKRPTCQMAQVGRVVPLPYPSVIALYGVRPPSSVPAPMITSTGCLPVTSLGSPASASLPSAIQLAPNWQLPACRMLSSRG
jgi:hypothetical protein